MGEGVLRPPLRTGSVRFVPLGWFGEGLFSRFQHPNIEPYLDTHHFVSGGPKDPFKKSEKFSLISFFICQGKMGTYNGIDLYYGS